MAALIVGLSVMAVLMTAAMPVWKHMAQREKEEELVFRGEQIAHAIGMFQRRTANAYPPSIDLLVQQKFLRKKYKDPITNDDFVPISQAQQAAGQQPTQPGQQGRGQQAQPSQPARGAAGASAVPGQAAAVVGGLVGVTSKSTDESIRLYKGRSHYNEWAFIYTPPAQTAGGGATGTPGAGGGGGQGQPGPNGPTFPGRGGRGPGGPFGPGRSATPFPVQIPQGGVPGR